MIRQELRHRYKIIERPAKQDDTDSYLVEDLDTPPPHRLCVVTHFHPRVTDPEEFKRLFPNIKANFEQEVLKIQEIGDQNIFLPTLYAYFEEEMTFFLVVQYIEGQSLRDEMSGGRIAQEKQARKILQELLEILQFVHGKGVMHLNLSPETIKRRKWDNKLVLLDFRIFQEPYLQPLSIYSPSEQASGKPKFSSDIYALGMITIELLTGFAPHNMPRDPQTTEFVWRYKVPNLSPEFADFLDKMVAPDCLKRFPDAKAAFTALKDISSDLAPTASDVHVLLKKARTTVLSQPNRRNFFMIVGGSILGAITLNALFPKEERINPVPTPSPSPTPNPTLSPTPLQTFSFTTVFVNDRGERIREENRQAEQMTISLGNGVTMELVKIPAGKFLMGEPSWESERGSNEGPQHEVSISSFFMGKYEVTQKQWFALMSNYDRDNWKENFENLHNKFKGDQRPIVEVNWNDAQEFCRLLSQQLNKTVRLPSEAQWEYACRAGTTTPFHFGETITPDLVNYDGDSPYGNAAKGQDRDQTTDVGSFPPNPFGLYDMHGNVWEWCEDVWHENYASAPTDGSPWTQGGDQEIRLLRGGSWYNYASYCRSANRGRNNPDNRGSHFGFRVCLL